MWRSSLLHAGRGPYPLCPYQEWGSTGQALIKTHDGSLGDVYGSFCVLRAGLWLGCVCRQGAASHNDEGCGMHALQLVHVVRCSGCVAHVPGDEALVVA